MRLMVYYYIKNVCSCFENFLLKGFYTKFFKKITKFIFKIFIFTKNINLADKIAI